MFEEIINIASCMVPFIVGFMQILKPLMKKNKKLIPAMSIVMGILLSLLFTGVSLLSVKIGLVSGLMSIGAYNVVRKSILKK